MPERVVIVGAGVVGLCAAWYCAQRGQHITVIERAQRERDGCSFGNAGLIVPSHFVPLAAPGMVARALRWMPNPSSPFYVQPRLSLDLARWAYRFWRAATPARVARAAPLLRDLSLASREAYRNLAAEGGQYIGLVERGLLILAATSHGLEEETRSAAIAERLGLTAQVLDADAAAALEPGLRMNIRGAVYYRDDCHLVPSNLLLTLEQKLLAHGCEFLWQTDVLGAERQGRRMSALRTSRGAVSADAVVLAAGVWSTHLARNWGLCLPMEAGKGYSLTLPAPQPAPTRPAILSEARVAVTPMGGTLRFGGTMELAGLNQQIRPRRVRGIVEAALRYYPDLEREPFEQARPWCGLRPCSPDGLPYVGRAAAWDNLLVATGHAMLGVSLAPVTGQIIARLIAGETPGFELALLSPDRFAR